MLTSLRIQNFKSWADTGELRLAPLTGLFGTNSSGKSSILQLLLMLKQTAESTDRAQVLNFGNELTSVELGTYNDIIRGHDAGRALEFDLSWELPEALAPSNPFNLQDGRPLFETQRLNFAARIATTGNGAGSQPAVQGFEYRFDGNHSSAEMSVNMRYKTDNKRSGYDLSADGFDLRRNQGRPWLLPKPVKCYGFPDEAFAYYQNTSFLADLELSFEHQFGRVFYLGPLREYPRREYRWSGGRPSDMGRRGEKVVDALLSSQDAGPNISPGYKRKRLTLEQRVALWLKELGLIASFRVSVVAPGSNLYQVLVRRVPTAEEVPLTDVGFGVSQILPVLTLCYYVPEGSTVILEQPEIHLHPAVQAGLGDVILDAIQNRKIQVIVESHSEHMLRRIQRRIAEDAFAAHDASLYFCALNSTGVSTAEELDVDPFGNIHNWPPEFFGNDMKEIASITLAQQARRRKLAANG